MGEEKREQIKYALVTGGSRGIGRAICVQLAKDTDYHILINYQSNKEAAEETLREVKSVGGQGELLPFDVVDAGSVIASLDQWQENHKESIIEVIVNNAGITRDNLILRMTPEDFQSVIDVNLTGTFNCMKLASRMMAKKRSGKIISISSIVGLHGNVGQTNYAASKAGVIGMTKTLAKELAGRNVTVNAIAPGFIRTAMTDQLNDDIKESLLSTIPMKKFGESEDVAKVAAFLASEDADYITGQVISVDGGMNI